MSTDGIRIGVGTRVLYDGQLWEVAELLPSAAGAEVVLRAYEVVRISLREVLEGKRARVYGEGVGPNADDPVDPADVVLSAMTEAERAAIQRRAEHIRETLTGYRSGTAEFVKTGEPRRDYDPSRPLTARYAAKAAELGVSMRTVQSWASDYLAFGEAGLARSTVSRQSPTGRVDIATATTNLVLVLMTTATVKGPIREIRRPAYTRPRRTIVATASTGDHNPFSPRNGRPTVRKAYTEYRTVPTGTWTPPM